MSHSIRIPAAFLVRCGLVVTLLMGSAATGVVRPQVSVAAVVGAARGALAAAWRHVLAVGSAGE